MTQTDGKEQYRYTDTYALMRGFTFFEQYDASAHLARHVGEQLGYRVVVEVVESVESVESTRDGIYFTVRTDADEAEWSEVEVEVTPQSSKQLLFVQTHDGGDDELPVEEAIALALHDGFEMVDLSLTSKLTARVLGFFW